MHIQRNKVVYKGKVYRSVLLRQCYYEAGKIKQKTIANLSKMPEYLIRSIELAIKRKEISYKIEDLGFEKGVNIGDIGVIYEIAKEIGIEEVIYSKRKKERDIILMMIIGRILRPSSKLENTRWIKRRKEAFGEYFKLDYERLRVDDLYKGMDWLMERKEKIEEKLYKKRGSPILFLYDITSSYFEGEKAEISEFGYNRDKKRGKRQIVIGLVMDKEGYPISIEVFRGNMADQKTIKGRIEKMKKNYGIERGVLIGDRGMITEARMEELEKEGFDYITCLTHRKIEELVKEKESPFYPELFDEKIPIEIIYKGKRYILCKNEEKEKEERKQLASLLWKTYKKLKEIRKQVEKGRLKDEIKIGERVGRWKNRYKVGKYFITEIKRGYFKFYIDKDQLELTKKLLGCYVIKTSLKEGFTKEQIIDHYKSLSLVDRAFRIIKRSLLNIRPIYHWKEKRIKTHAFICMLSYYIVVEMKKRLKELFFENGKGRQYSLTFKNILEELREIQIGYINVNGLIIKQLSKMNQLQKDILKNLKVELKLRNKLNTN